MYTYDIMKRTTSSNSPVVWRKSKSSSKNASTKNTSSGDANNLAKNEKSEVSPVRSSEISKALNVLVGGDSNFERLSKLLFKQMQKSSRSELSKMKKLIENASLKIMNPNQTSNIRIQKFLFPIQLKMTVKDMTYTTTELIASTGPKTNSIHMFHRLLSTAYPDKYNKAMKELHKIITKASKDLNPPLFKTADSPNNPPSKKRKRRSNTPQLPISFAAGAFHKLSFNTMPGNQIEKRQYNMPPIRFLKNGVIVPPPLYESQQYLSSISYAREIRNVLKNHGMYMYEEDVTHGNNKMQLSYKAAIMVDWS